MVSNIRTAMELEVGLMSTPTFQLGKPAMVTGLGLSGLLIYLISIPSGRVIERAVFLTCVLRKEGWLNTRTKLQC